MKSTSGSETLAADLGYDAPSWDRHRPSAMSSMTNWAAPPPPPAESSEAERWGYTPKPYVPPSMPIPSMQLLSVPQMQHHAPAPPSNLPGAHLVVENVPGELNIMSLLYEHFKQFGEAPTSIHCIPKYNKALVDFTSRELADLAASRPVLGVPSIRVSVYSGPARGAPRPAAIPSIAPPTNMGKNMVLESEVAKKARERREGQAEMDKKRLQILETCTQHVKQIVAKLADKSISDEAREQYMAMLTSVKSKITDLQKVDAEKRKKDAIQMQKNMALRYKAYEKQARVDSSRRQQELTLDLRSRNVRISQLPEELIGQSVVLVEYLRAMGMKELNEIIWLDQHAVLRFANHAAAECLVKHELAFQADWVSNEEAQNIANYNPVEQVEITPLEDEETENAHNS